VKWRGVFQPLVFESLKSPTGFVACVRRSLRFATPFWAADGASDGRSATPRWSLAGHKSRSDDQVFVARGHDTRGLASHEDYDN
jgi:hypothetical protein